MESREKFNIAHALHPPLKPHSCGAWGGGLQHGDSVGMYRLTLLCPSSLGIS